MLGPLGIYKGHSSTGGQDSPKPQIIFRLQIDGAHLTVRSHFVALTTDLTSKPRLAA